MTDAAELERRLAALEDEIAVAEKRAHDLTMERNNVMRALAREHGVSAPTLHGMVRIKSLPLVYRIVQGKNR